MRLLLPMLLLALSSPTLASDLPTTETPVGRLALPVVPDSLILSPDSSRLVFATKAGDLTLEDKGVFLHPGEGNPINDSASAPRNPIRLYIDDKSTIPFDLMTPAAFSPDSKRLGYAGMRDKKWTIVIDNKTLTQDADGTPANPIVFSPDSARVAWAVQKNEQFLITVDKTPWPPINAGAIGLLTFSPDSRHLAAIARIKTGWVLYIDGNPLPTPPAPLAPAATTAPSARPPSTLPAKTLDRFTQFLWRPDSSGIAFSAAFTGSRWQLFSQSLDGSFPFISQPHDALMKNAPAFSPDSQHLAFGVTTRNKWTMITDTEEFPAPPAAPFDQLFTDSVSYYEPLTPDSPPATQIQNPKSKIQNLLYLAQQNRKWQLYLNHKPAGDPYDSVIQTSFLISPDKHHYAFAATRNGQTLIIKDGATLATHDEAGALTFAFSPDSQHLAYAARIGSSWHPCIDGTPGAPFPALAGSPIAFSPDSARIAFVAPTPQKTWRLFIGKDADLQSKPYDAFLKGTHITWRPDGTLVTIAIQKKVATRIEAKP